MTTTDQPYTTGRILAELVAARDEQASDFTAEEWGVLLSEACPDGGHVDPQVLHDLGALDIPGRPANARWEAKVYACLGGALAREWPEAAGGTR